VSFVLLESGTQILGKSCMLPDEFAETKMKFIKF